MREFEPDFDPIKIVEEMLATKDTGDDKQIPVSIAYRDATALAMFLRVPRSAAEVVFESDESERGKEFKEFMVSFFTGVETSVDIGSEDEIDTESMLLSKSSIQESFPYLPNRESLIWMVADKFPVVETPQTDSEWRDFDQRMEEPFSMELNYREIVAIGDAVERELIFYKEQDQSFHYGQDNYANAFLRVQKSFEDNGGRKDVELRGRINRLLGGER